MGKYKFSEIEDYFLKKLVNLKEILDSDKDFEAALIALCYIDALGNLFAEGNTTKSRFLNLLFLHGTVDAFRWDKVNLAEFKKAEKNNKLKLRICPSCYEVITLYIDQNICQYDYSGSTECMKKDRILSEVINDITAVGKKKTCKCNIISKALLRCLYDSTYGGTLYREYRCESVHKAKFDMLWSSLEDHFSEPYYVDVQDEWPDFSIPARFVVRTFEQCLTNLKNNSA